MQTSSDVDADNVVQPVDDSQAASAQSDTGSGPTATSSNISSAELFGSNGNTGPPLAPVATDSPRQDETVPLQNDILFLSASVHKLEAIARAIDVGDENASDKSTFETLRTEYRRMCNKWYVAKHITGIRFYRVS